MQISLRPGSDEIESRGLGGSDVVRGWSDVVRGKMVWPLPSLLEACPCAAVLQATEAASGCHFAWAKTPAAPALVPMGVPAHLQTWAILSAKRTCHHVWGGCDW